MDVFHCPPSELAQRLTYYDYIEVLIYLNLRDQKDGKGFELAPEDLLKKILAESGHLLPSFGKQK